VGLTAAAVALAAGGTASAAAPAKTLSFFEKNESFVYTAPGGKPERGLPAGQPATGSTIEFTDLNYPGTEKHHQHPWTSTDHFLCTFGSNGTTCEGQIAIGASMLIVKGNGGQGTFSSRSSPGRARSRPTAGRSISTTSARPQTRTSPSTSRSGNSRDSVPAPRAARAPNPAGLPRQRKWFAIVVPQRPLLGGD
jgi:hypothetical protein